MRNYSPDAEPGTERLLLITLPNAEYGGDHRHLHASVMRRAERSYVNGEGRNVYGDGSDAAGYRMASWSSGKASGKNSAVFVEDLEMRCQMTIRELSGNPGDKKVYGSDYAFYQTYKVDSSTAKAMVSTFAKLEKGLSALYTDFGNVGDGDFAALCTRVAHVLGIKTFVIRRTVEGARSSSSLDNSGAFRELRACDLPHHVQQMVDSCYPKEAATQA